MFTYNKPGTTETLGNASEWFSNYSVTGTSSVENMYSYFSSTDQFQTYVQNQAADDLNAYKAALNLASANLSAENSDIVGSALTDGWSNSDIAAILSLITGN